VHFPSQVILIEGNPSESAKRFFQKAADWRMQLPGFNPWRLDFGAREPEGLFSSDNIYCGRCLQTLVQHRARFRSPRSRNCPVCEIFLSFMLDDCSCRMGDPGTLKYAIRPRPTGHRLPQSDCVPTPEVPTPHEQMQDENARRYGMAPFVAGQRALPHLISPDCEPAEGFSSYPASTCSIQTKG